MNITSPSGARVFFTVLVFFFSLLPISLSAQVDYLDPDTDIDSIFAESSDEVAAAETNISGEAESTISAGPDDSEDSDEWENPGRPVSDLTRESRVTLKGEFLFSLGYAAGWGTVPWMATDGGFGEFRHGAVTDAKSALNLDFRIAPVFKVYLTFKFAFPTFRAEISEFFADYCFFDAAYLRAGRQTISWGISPYFRHTDLLARLPDGFPVDGDEYDDELHDADSYGFKLDVPVGIGGLELVGFTRNGYMADPDSPSASDIGWGGTINVAVPYFDATLATFYLEMADWRSSLSVSTTLFDRTEYYAEGLLSCDLPVDDLQWGANTGFVLGLWKQRLQISGEYYYTTETRDLRIKGSDYPLIRGHNITGGLSLEWWEGKARIYSLVQYNVDENSGLVIPSISLDAMPFLSALVAVPVVFGDADGTYMIESPAENQDRAASLILALMLRASF